MLSCELNSAHANDIQPGFKTLSVESVGHKRNVDEVRPRCATNWSRFVSARSVKYQERAKADPETNVTDYVFLSKMSSTSLLSGLCQLNQPRCEPTSILGVIIHPNAGLSSNTAITIRDSPELSGSVTQSTLFLLFSKNQFGALSFEGCCFASRIIRIRSLVDDDFVPYLQVFLCRLMECSQMPLDRVLNNKSSPGSLQAAKFIIQQSIQVEALSTKDNNNLLHEVVSFSVPIQLGHQILNDFVRFRYYHLTKNSNNFLNFIKHRLLINPRVQLMNLVRNAVDRPPCTPKYHSSHNTTISIDGFKQYAVGYAGKFDTDRPKISKLVNHAHIPTTTASERIFRQEPQVLGADEMIDLLAKLNCDTDNYVRQRIQCKTLMIVGDETAKYCYNNLVSHHKLDISNDLMYQSSEGKEREEIRIAKSDLIEVRFVCCQSLSQMQSCLEEVNRLKSSSSGHCLDSFAGRMACTILGLSFNVDDCECDIDRSFSTCADLLILCPSYSEFMKDSFDHGMHLAAMFDVCARNYLNFALKMQQQFKISVVTIGYLPLHPLLMYSSQLSARLIGETCPYVLRRELLERRLFRHHEPSITEMTDSDIFGLDDEHCGVVARIPKRKIEEPLMLIREEILYQDDECLLHEKSKSGVHLKICGLWRGSGDLDRCLFGVPLSLECHIRQIMHDHPTSDLTSLMHGILVEPDEAYDCEYVWWKEQSKLVSSLSRRYRTASVLVCWLNELFKVVNIWMSKLSDACNSLFIDSMKIVHDQASKFDFDVPSNIASINDLQLIWTELLTILSV